MELEALVETSRPHRADAARNYDALIETAKVVFREEGITASLEEVARRAGVGIGTLYRNFPTREDLIERVYASEVLVLCRKADGHLEDGGSEWAAFEAWLREFIPFLATKRALLDGLNRGSETMLCCRTAMYAAGEPLLENAQRAGLVRPDVEIADVIRLVVGVAGVAYETEEQGERVLGFAFDGIRTTRA